jgi:hypothetical protein
LLERAITIDPLSAAARFQQIDRGNQGRETAEPRMRELLTVDAERHLQRPTIETSRQIARLVGLGRAFGPHLVKENGNASLSKLPGGLGPGKPAAHHMDGECIS